MEKMANTSGVAFSSKKIRRIQESGEDIISGYTYT